MVMVRKRDISVYDFDLKVFYGFYNAVRLDKALSAGNNKDLGGAIFMAKAEINSTFAYSSSENWQIYYQAGRYFIRNYDYEDLQLGLTKNEQTVPRLMNRSGVLGQQWSLIRADGKDAGWKLSNGLLGNGSWLGFNGMNGVPAMQPSDARQVATTLSSSSFTPSATTSASTSKFSDNLQPTSGTQTGSHSTLSTGAIVGIAIGGFAFVLIAAILGWVLVARWKRKEEPADLIADVKQPYVHRVEIGGEPVVHIAQERNYVGPRVEVE